METLSPITRNKRGKVIHSAKRLCIVNNFKQLTTENPTMKKDKAMEKVAELTGVSKRSVYSVINAYLKNKTLGLTAPKNKKPRLAAVDKLDEFTKCAIRRKVHEFFFKNEQPTINKVLSAVNNDKDLPDFKRSTLHKLLKSLNFKFNDRRRLVFLRDRSLPEIVEYRLEQPTVLEKLEIKQNIFDKNATPSHCTDSGRPLEKRPRQESAEDEQDDDRMFMLGLAGKMKQLSPADNMEFRLQVQQLLLDKLCPDERSNNSASSSSSPPPTPPPPFLAVMIKEEVQEEPLTDENITNADELEAPSPINIKTEIFADESGENSNAVASGDTMDYN